MKRDDNMAVRRDLWARMPVKILFLALCDAVCVFASYFCTLLFRFGGEIPQEFVDVFYVMVLPFIVIYLLCFAAFHLYSSLWEHASVDELLETVAAIFVGFAICLALSLVTGMRLPISVYVAANLILILLIGWLRMFYRIARRI